MGIFFKLASLILHCGTKEASPEKGMVIFSMLHADSFQEDALQRVIGPRLSGERSFIGALKNSAKELRYGKMINLLNCLHIY